MLQVRNLHYAIGARQLLAGVDWVIHPNKRAALIGPNGAGKTTLLRIIHGDISDYQGTIIKPQAYRIGYLPQEEISIGRGTVLDIVLEGQQQILDLERRIAEIHDALKADTSDHQALLQQLGNLTHYYEALQGYQFEATAKSILTGLGFEITDFNRPLSDFSGGWRMRAYLARLLIQTPDLLLLDEPTNHLDLPSLEWLEQYLLSFRGAMVIVSHDRFFIDRLAQEIYELERGRLEHYPGNYHFYEQQKEEKERQLQKKFEEMRAERERQERFINRFRYKATKAAQVQSRIKMLEKLEQVELPPPPRRLNFRLTVTEPSYQEVVIIRNLWFRYAVEWVLENVDLQVYRGEKIALVGVNGAGKTTLTRLIAGQLAPSNGTLQIGPRTKIGYYAQHQVDTLNLDATAYDEVAATVARDHFPRIRDILGGFQLTGDDVYKKIRVLSGGEKARVSLAKILLSEANFLIMDEPTNHLDMASKEALEQALANYPGTLLIISHDRYFLDKIVHRVIEIRNHQLRSYEGNYSDYLARRQAEPEVALESAPEKSEAITSSKKTKEQKRLEAAARQAVSQDRRRLTSEVAMLEQTIADLEKKQLEIENELAKPETYQNSERSRTLPAEYRRIKEQLQSCYDRWAEAQIELEELLKRIPERKEK
ncbi:MAG: ABC-F family ATP-binding cassette domain-containing protein [candidate division KSB1 bacterium]|nr:ABC-F family ATP-binding cassette domain-containing protein [candidate division KSB1 bacterium]MDZ7341968.1 ABC-F family ATP-binding cassette domain-containing protein [candidate division KSB1 bacterium]